MKLIDKATVIGQANIDITNLRIAQEEGILTEYGKGMLEGLEGIVDFINTLETRDIDEIIINAEDHAYFAGSEKTREKLIDKACKWLRKGGSGWYLTSESGEDEINFVKLAEDFRKAMEDET